MIDTSAILKRAGTLKAPAYDPDARRVDLPATMADLLAWERRRRRRKGAVVGGSGWSSDDEDSDVGEDLEPAPLAVIERRYYQGGHGGDPLALAMARPGTQTWATCRDVPAQSAAAGFAPAVRVARPPGPARPPADDPRGLAGLCLGVDEYTRCQGIALNRDYPLTSDGWPHVQWLAMTLEGFGWSWGQYFADQEDYEANWGTAANFNYARLPAYKPEYFDAETPLLDLLLSCWQHLRGELAVEGVNLPGDVNAITVPSGKLLMKQQLQPAAVFAAAQARLRHILRTRAWRRLPGVWPAAMRAVARYRGPAFLLPEGDEHYMDIAVGRGLGRFLAAVAALAELRAATDVLVRECGADETGFWGTLITELSHVRPGDTGPAARPAVRGEKAGRAGGVQPPAGPGGQGKARRRRRNATLVEAFGDEPAGAAAPATVG